MLPPKRGTKMVEHRYISHLNRDIKKRLIPRVPLYYSQLFPRQLRPQRRARLIQRRCRSMQPACPAAAQTPAQETKKISFSTVWLGGRGCLRRLWAWFVDLLCCREQDWCLKAGEMGRRSLGGAHKVGLCRWMGVITLLG